MAIAILKDGATGWHYYNFVTQVEPGLEVESLHIFKYTPVYSEVSGVMMCPSFKILESKKPCQDFHLHPIIKTHIDLVDESHADTVGIQWIITQVVRARLEYR